MNSLLISEDFYSVQCEGISTGIPSYFVRLTNCNLSCGATPKFVNQFKKEEVNYDPGTFQGDLHAEGKATWTCDTIPVWAKGNPQPFQYLTDRWKAEGLYEEIKNGSIHIIWTGGEPTLMMHQKAIIEFTEWWKKEDPSVCDTVLVDFREQKDYFLPFYELETNGTIEMEDKFFKLMKQINCSVKLANSGMPEKKRINPDALKQINHPKSQFKFVISTEDDIKEIFDTFVKPFSIPLYRVVCMPGLDDQKDFHERTRFVLEMAKKYKFRGLTRLHVSAWNKTTGV